LGTLTLGIDGPGGLLAEHSYREVIDEARRAGAVMCELTRFAVAPMTDCRAVMAPLLTSAYRLAKHEHEATDVFIEVNPRHVAFYRRGFGFAVAAGERFCHRARAPSVLLRLELAHLQERLQMLERAAAAS
jgi:predicted amidophosphoribosyltransferase